MAATALTPTHNTIDLACWTCDRTWRIVRRRGQYPRCCPTCRTKRRVPAQQLAKYAARLNLPVEVRQHPEHGLSLWVQTPFHDRPVILRDHADCDWLARELRAS